MTFGPVVVVWILTFFGIATIPSLTDKIALAIIPETLTFIPYISDIIFHFIQFFFNFGLNMASNWYHVNQVCSPVQWGAVVLTSLIPSIGVIVLWAVITFFPPLKAVVELPLMIFSMLGYDWITKGAMNIFVHYNPLFMIQMMTQRGVICVMKKALKKKNEKKKKKK
jgi:hypothetical protein